MTHWADAYVGRPARGARPCWDLVRQVWIDRLGFVMPSFDETDDPEEAVGLGASRFAHVATGLEMELDAVMMLVPLQTRSQGRLGFRNAETHIGVVARPGLVLHVEKGRTAVVEDIRALKVSRILRGPWAGGAA